MRGERIQIPIKTGHHWLPANGHLNGVSLVGRRWPSIEGCHGSFVNFQGMRTSCIAKEPYSFVIYPPAPTIDLHMD